MKRYVSYEKSPVIAHCYVTDAPRTDLVTYAEVESERLQDAISWCLRLHPFAVKGDTFETSASCLVGDLIDAFNSDELSLAGYFMTLHLPEGTTCTERKLMK